MEEYEKELYVIIFCNKEISSFPSVWRFLCVSNKFLRQKFENFLQ